MTLALMIYGIVIGSLLAGAAHFLDRGLRAIGHPTRWVWGLAMAAAAGIPAYGGWPDASTWRWKGTVTEGSWPMECR